LGLAGALELVDAGGVHAPVVEEALAGDLDHAGIGVSDSGHGGVFHGVFGFAGEEVFELAGGELGAIEGEEGFALFDEAAGEIGVDLLDPAIEARLEFSANAVYDWGGACLHNMCDRTAWSRVLAYSCKAVSAGVCFCNCGASAEPDCGEACACARPLEVPDETPEPGSLGTSGSFNCRFFGIHFKTKRSDDRI